MYLKTPYLCGMLARKEHGGIVATKSLLEAAWAESTLKAYKGWTAKYFSYCEASGLDPYDLSAVISWLESLAGRHKLSSIEQAAAAVRFLYKANGKGNPFEAEPLRLLMRALRRKLGAAKKQVKPITPAQLSCMRWDAGPKGLRDKALILIGFGAALRVSELIALQYSDIEITPEGVILTIRRSKTDQAGKGRLVAIPKSEGPLCPVRALEAYLRVRGRQDGPLFQSLHKSKLTGRPLSRQAVDALIKDYMDRLGLDYKAYSTHSMRAGFATAAALNGADLETIASQTGHKSMEVLRGYIRRANLFQRNAAKLVLG